MHLDMLSFQKHVALLLIGLFFSFSINAYACLVPIYSGMVVNHGSDCTTPGEEPASQFCEGFKSLAVQSSSDIPTGGFSHFLPGGSAPSLFPASVTRSQFLPLPARDYVPLPEDTLVLISVFRI